MEGGLIVMSFWDVCAPFRTPRVPFTFTGVTKIIKQLQFCTIRTRLIKVCCTANGSILLTLKYRD